MLKLLHLCDSLFPLGGFAYSDGLETAAASGLVGDAEGLAAWLDVSLDETIGRLDGPAAWQAWGHIRDEQWDALSGLDEELVALRPSSAGRRATRAMGRRLLTTWRALYATPQLDRLQDHVDRGELAPTLPVAFAGACISAGINRHDTVTAFAYTRLASTVSAAMRLAPIERAVLSNWSNLRWLLHSEQGIGVRPARYSLTKGRTTSCSKRSSWLTT